MNTNLISYNWQCRPKSFFQKLIALTVSSILVWFLVCCQDLKKYLSLAPHLIKNSPDLVYFRDINFNKVREECLKNNSEKDENTNTTTPAAFMPKDIIIQSLTSFKGCKTSATTDRVLFVLSRLHSYKQRYFIRNSYAAFKKYSDNKIKSRWTRFFLIGMPKNNEEKLKIEAEISKNDDIVVSNTLDVITQKESTIKYLIGIKVVSCFCPSAKYLIKVDDDSYLRVKEVERVLVSLEKKLEYSSQSLTKRKEAEIVQLQASYSKFPRFYTGGVSFSSPAQNKCLLLLIVQLVKFSFGNASSFS